MNKYKNNNIRINANYNIKNQYCRIIKTDEKTASQIIKTADAIKYAQSLNLDLIEIGYDKKCNCSNCIVYNFSKYMYDLKINEKNAKKLAKANKIETKTVQFTLTTDTADKKRIINHAKEFLEDRNKVKISLKFRDRREANNMKLATTCMREILNEFKDCAIIDAEPTLANRALVCVLRKA